MADDRLYGKETRNALVNFPSRDRTLGDLREFVRNYSLVKRAAAVANHAAGRLDSTRRDAIVTACEEIASGLHADQFPTALVHGGGGTTTNMNLNEVIATRASALAGVPVHPNDHVNASQATNDTYQTAMALTLLELSEEPLAAVAELIDTLEAKAREFAHVTHLGRTCLNDAVTTTAGKTHHAHAAGLRRTSARLRSAIDELSRVPLGATVVGTGIGVPPQFAERCIAELVKLSNRPLSSAEDLPDSVANFDSYEAVAAACTQVAISMAKVAGDVRLLSSGPRGGFGDIRLPAVQAGSSMLPAKTNPVIPEYVLQLSYRVRASAHAVELAVAAGELEINVMEPVILDALTRMLADLAAAASIFARRCIAGLTWDGLRRESNLDAALDAWVEMSGTAGYNATTAQRRVTEGVDGCLA